MARADRRRNRSCQSTLEQLKTTAFKSTAATHSIKGSLRFSRRSQFCHKGLRSARNFQRNGELFDYTTVSRKGALQALRNNTEPQHSTTRLQIIQYKTVKNNEFQQISITSRIWFGTRGSEVQILSPRPFFSRVYRLAWLTPWNWPRCSGASRRFNIGLLAAI